MKNNLPQSQPGWHNRGYLPHFDGGELAQFITFRLHDALPAPVLLRWKEELKHERPGEVESIMRRRVEAYLDQAHGNCYLKDAEVATIVQECLALSRSHEIPSHGLDDNAEPRSFVVHTRDWPRPCGDYAFTEVLHIERG